MKNILNILGKLFILLLLVTIFYVISCKVKQNIEFRSGSTENANIEEPLTNETQKYNNNLTISNHILDQLIEGNYDNIYENYISEKMEKVFSKQQFINMNKKIINSVGVIINYKPLQWYFILKNENSQDLLYSIKIVQHEKEMLYYQFIFDRNNDKMIVGFYVTQK